MSEKKQLTLLWGRHQKEIYSKDALTIGDLVKLSIIAAVSKNKVIGSGSDIPWSVKGEQLIFKALTYSHWLIVGRKTFESMGELPDRKYAVISRKPRQSNSDNVHYFLSVNSALAFLEKVTDHAFIAGGGEIYKAFIKKADILHISEVQTEPEGDVVFPGIPNYFEVTFRQQFNSNLDYEYQIWQRVKK